MKRNITLTVDIDKKKLFEKLSKFHEMTFSDALALGIDTVLDNTSNEDFLKLKIAETKTRLSDLEHALAEIQNK